MVYIEKQIPPGGMCSFVQLVFQINWKAKTQQTREVNHE